MNFTNHGAAEVTLLPNLFIDEYMPKANGEYVKLYLYLLRLGSQELTVPCLADKLELTERDVLRALRYWKNEGLIRYEAEEGETPELLELLPLRVSDKPAAPKTEDKPAAEAPAKAEASPEKTPEVPARRSYGNQELAELKSRDEHYADLLLEMQMYFGRTLTSRDAELMAYLYDELKLPADLLEYLLEYCVEMNKKNARYMETVALNWHREGKRTLEAVKQSQSSYTQINRTVLKAFGIQNRGLGESEQQYAVRWSEEWKLSPELIAEACSRTLRNTGKVSFEYADKILEDWHQKKITSLRELKDAAAAPAVLRPAAKNTKFGFDFEQRNTDYDALLWQKLRDEYAEGKIDYGTDE